MNSFPNNDSMTIFRKKSLRCKINELSPVKPHFFSRQWSSLFSYNQFEKMYRRYFGYLSINKMKEGTMIRHSVLLFRSFTAFSLREKQSVDISHAFTSFHDVNYVFCVVSKCLLYFLVLPNSNLCYVLVQRAKTILKFKM